MATFDINNTARRAQYTSTGQTGPFAFNFQVNASSELKVYIDDVEKTESTHYTATLNADGTGSVTFNTATTSGELISIIGDQPLSRTTVFSVGQANNPTTLETEFDNVVIRQQQIKEITDRALQLKPSTPRTVTGSGTSGPIFWPYDATPSNNADKVIAYDSNGTSLILGPTTTDLSTVAGISSDITTVSGIASNVTTVANDGTDIGLVATNIASVNTVATNINDVIKVADDLNEAVSEVETVANDLNEAVSEIDTVAGSISNVDIVGTNIANVNTVGGISANVTTVAGVSSNVTTVAGISSDVTTVAGISSDVTTLAGISSDITTVRGINLAITNVSPHVNAIANINTNLSNVLAVNTNSANINTVAGNNTNINTVASNDTNITTVAGISANVTSVAGISSDVTSVAGDATDIGTVATDLAGSDNIGTVAGAITNVNNVGGSIANVNTVAGIDGNVTTVAGISADVTSVAGISTAVSNVNSNSTNINAVNANSSNINAVASDATDIGIVATDIANVNTVAGISSNVTTVANDGTDIGTVATNIANVNLVGGSIANVNTVGSNITGVNSFAERYRVASSDPTTSLDAGDLAFNTTGSVLKYYDGSSWQGITAGGITDVVQDSSPQLGGDLSLNSNDITGTGNINITGNLTASGNLTSTGIDDNATSNAITIDSSERVGIGYSSTLNGNLNVNGNVGLGNFISASNPTGGTYNLTDPDGSNINQIVRIGEDDDGGNAVADLQLVSYGSNNNFGGGNLRFVNSRYSENVALIKGSREAATTGYLAFYTYYGGLKERMHIHDNGDISFYEDTGTTAKLFWDASQEQLNLTGSVAGSVPFTTYSSGYTSDYNSYSAEEGFQIMSYQTDGGSPYTKTSDLIANGDSTVPSEMRFLTKSNGSSNPTERMRIDSSGLVGIGTSSPSDILTIAGEGTTGTNQINHTQSADSSGYSPSLAMNKSRGSKASPTVVQSGDQTGAITFAGYDGTNYRNTASIESRVDGTPGTDDMPGRLVFFTTEDGASSPTERMRIDSSGNLLVGTTTAPNIAGAIHVANSSGHGLQITNTSASKNRRIYMASTGNLYFWNGTNEGYLSDAGAWTNASDERLKNNIRNIEYGLNTVLSTKPRHYERNDVEGTYIGFIAQELQNIIPEVVSGNPDKQLGIDYGSLVAVAFKAIQEQQTQIEELKAEVTALKNQP